MQTTTDDDQLMIRIQEGDPNAFEAIVLRHQGPLIGFFFTNTRDRQLSEDLTQETLLRVYDQAWDYLPVGRFRGWMFRVARNLLIDTVRRHAHDALIRAVHGADDEQTLLSNLASELISPLDLAQQREIGALVDEMLNDLPEDQRLTFTLHHYADLSLPEVAQIMETSVPTTKSRLRLAREKLRLQLESRGVENPLEEDQSLDTE